MEYRILPVKFAFSSCLESIKGEFKLLCVLILLTLFTLCFGSFLSYFGGFVVFPELVSTRWVGGWPSLQNRVFLRLINCELREEK